MDPTFAVWVSPTLCSSLIAGVEGGGGGGGGRGKPDPAEEEDHQIFPQQQQQKQWDETQRQESDLPRR